MLILGIDPGATTIGYALIETHPSPRCMNAGLFAVTAPENHQRLADLSREMEGLIRRWKPAALAVEKLFFAKNAKTAMTVAESRGVILLTASRAGLSVFEYAPLEVKKALTGDGRADKEQVEKMIRLTLPDSVPARARDDVYDAIAVGLTCCFRERHFLSNSFLS